MRTHLLRRILAFAVLVSLVLAPAAEAFNDGRGFYGATNDKVVTNAGFLLIIFFRPQGMFGRVWRSAW